MGRFVINHTYCSPECFDGLECGDASCANTSYVAAIQHALDLTQKGRPFVREIIRDHSLEGVGELQRYAPRRRVRKQWKYGGLERVTIGGGERCLIWMSWGGFGGSVGHIHAIL